MNITRGVNDPCSFSCTFWLYVLFFSCSCNLYIVWVAILWWPEAIEGYKPSHQRMHPPESSALHVQSEIVIHLGCLTIHHGRHQACHLGANLIQVFNLLVGVSRELQVYRISTQEWSLALYIEGCLLSVVCHTNGLSCCPYCDTPHHHRATSQPSARCCKKNASLTWTDDSSKAFNDTKDALATANTSSCIVTNASDAANGAVLQQQI